MIYQDGPTDNNHKCFFCGEQIEGIGVEWTESNNYALNPSAEGAQKIYLHPKCSVSLGVRLIGDGFTSHPADERRSLIGKVKIWVEGRLRQ